MDQSEVERIIEENVERLKKKLELEKWDITFEYGSLDGDELAVCLPNIEYQHAVIRIDPNKMNNKTHILHIMLHELVHCIICTFVTYRLAIARLIDVERGYDAANVIYDRAEEEVVVNFVRILERVENENKTV